MKSPILLIVFNRPETTTRVFESIRQAAPPRLYVAGDGARASVDGEKELVQRVRQIATAVDWPCQLSTRFLKRNLGCKHAVISALNWFFAIEREGVVLEDDCLPHADFFSYCDWALSTYRDDSRVFQINGNNFAAPERLYDDKPLAFTPLAQAWGWASWADRWRHFEGNPFYVDTSRFQRWPLSLKARWHKRHHVRLLRQGLDAWDYQWQIAILNANGVCLSSRANLISNLGDGDAATHTKNDPRIGLPTKALDGNLPRCEPKLSRPVTRWYERKMDLRSTIRFVRILAQHLTAELIAGLERVAARVLFGKSPPIVVASTGRTGSTLLFHAIAEAVIEQRFGKTCSKWLPPFISNRARAFGARMADIEKLPHRVLKTHDLYDPRYSGAARFVFVYGDPLESALSAANMAEEHGRIWLEEHLFHLSSKGDYEDLFRSDLLNFDQQMRAWAGGNPGNVLMVSFDELWEAAPAISAFIGLKIRLPEQRQRAPKRSTEFDERVFSRLRDQAIACADRRTQTG